MASNEKQRFALIHASTYNRETTGTSGDEGPLSGGVPDAASDSNPVNAATEELNDTNPQNYYIRANQGHSIALGADDIDTLLKPITIEQDNLPAIVVHGTRHDAWTKILASGGLKPMGRMHVHFATGVPEGLRWTSSHNVAHGSATGANNGSRNESGKEFETVETLSERAPAPAPAVISGMRNSSSILIFIDLRRALEKDIKFYLSENGVVLSAGDEVTGIVPVDIFAKVEERGGRLLMKNGVVIADAEQSPARNDRAGGGRGRAGRADTDRVSKRADGV